MQTEYSINQAAGLPGQIADSAIVKDIITGINSTGKAYFGRVVTKGASTDEIVHPDLAAEVTNEKLVRGIIVASHEIESVRDNDAPHYPQGHACPIMRKGRVWVESETAVSEGTSDVYVRVAGNLGKFTSTSDTTNTAVLPKAKWKSSTSGANQLAVVEIDL